MTIQSMTLSEKGNAGENGVVYNKNISLSGAVNSAAITLPEIPLAGVAVQKTGLVAIYATAGTPAQITADTCIWELWDGYSLFNPAITALYAANPSGDSVINISVRGSL